MVETYHHIRYARAGRFEDPVVEPFAGAYLAGSGEEAAYDGSMLAEDVDIVVVTSLTPFRTPEDSLMYQTILFFVIPKEYVFLSAKQD